MTPEQVKEMYGTAARDYSRPEKNTMVMRVFQPNEETNLKSGYAATRSINGLKNYDIQLPSDAVANARRDWPLAILKDGETATQVGAVTIDQNGLQLQNSLVRRLVKKAVALSKLAGLHFPSRISTDRRAVSQLRSH